MKIPWSARITSEDVMRRTERGRKLLRAVKIRKTAYLGHVLNNKKYALLHTILQRKVDRRKSIGRKMKSWLRNIREWTNMGVEERFRVARDREAFTEVVAYLR